MLTANSMLCPLAGLRIGLQRHRIPARVGPAAQNIFVISLVGRSRTFAHNRAKSHMLLSTLIEACASRRRRSAISNEEQADV